MPGKIEWDKASPMSDIFLNTMKLPNMPQVTPTITDVKSALSAHSELIVCKKLSKLMQFHTKI